MIDHHNQIFDLGSVDWYTFEKALRDQQIRYRHDYQVIAREGSIITLRFKPGNATNFSSKALATYARLAQP